MARRQNLRQTGGRAGLGPLLGLLLVLAGPEAALAAQDQAELRLAIEARCFPADPGQAEVHRSLAEAFAAALVATAGLGPVSSSFSLHPDPANASDAVSLAGFRQAGCQAAAILELADRGRRTTMTLRLYDPVLGRIVAGSARTAMADLTLFSQIQDLAAEAGAVLVRERQALQAPRSLDQQVLTLSGLSLTGGDEATEVYLNGWILLGQVEDGRIDYPLPVARGQRINLLLKKPGFHPRQVVLEPRSSGQELALPPLEPLHYWGVQATWDPAMPASAGLAFRFYPLPDRWYLQLEAGWRNADTLWNPSGNPADQGYNTDNLVAAPLRHYGRFGLETGVLFGETDQLLRLYAGLGGGLFLYLPGSAQTDLVLPSVYLSAPVLGLEFRQGAFRAGLALASEFVFDTGTTLVNAGTTRIMLPGQLYVGVTW